MMSKPFFLALFLSIVLNTTSYSQSNSIENVVKVSLRNMGPILTESEVSGYYMFYQTDKLNKKVYSYEVQILDQNLNSVGSYTIKGSKDLYLGDGVYNQETLLLKLYDLKLNTCKILQLDKHSNKLTSKTREVGKYEEQITLQASQTDEGQNITVFPINNVGFLDYRPEKIKKLGYVIDFYPSSEKYTKWTYKSSSTATDLQFATHIYGDENIIICSITKKSSAMSKKVDMSVLAINAKTGKKMYEKDINDPNYELYIMNGLESDSEGNIFVFGTYYEKGEKELSNPSLGLFSAKVDAKGIVVEKNFTSWAKDVSSFVPMNQKGKMEKVGYVFFHDIVRNADGNIYAIGEQFKKQASGVGIASNLLNRGNSGAAMAEMVVGDMMILELNSDYKLEKVNIIDKEKSKVLLPSGMGLVSPQMLSYYIKANGGFDYSFIEFNKNKSIFTIGYLDYVKVKGEPNEFIFGSITYADSMHSTDKLKITTTKEKRVIRLLPAKIGNLLVVEYIEDEKRIDLRLKNINY